VGSGNAVASASYIVSFYNYNIKELINMDGNGQGFLVEIRGNHIAVSINIPYPYPLCD